MNAPRLMTPEVRQGFSYAFPYEEVVDGVYSGSDSNAPARIPDSVRGYDPDVFLYQTDLAKAKELILAGGFAEGDGFEYMVDANPRSAVETIAQLFQANVAADGLQPRADRGRQRHRESTDLRRLAGRGAPPLHRRLGLVAGLQRPLEPARAQLPRGQHRRRRRQRRLLGQRALRGDHGRGGDTTPTSGSSS